MIYNNVELFNVFETDETERGVVLQRFSKEAREDTRNRAAWMASAAMGLEIRLVTDAEVFWITLGAEDQNIDISATIFLAVIPAFMIAGAAVAFRAFKRTTVFLTRSTVF